MLGTSAIQVTMMGRAMTFGEFLQCATLFTHTSMVGSLLYGSIGIWLAISSLDSITGKAVTKHVLKNEAPAGSQEDEDYRFIEVKEGGLFGVVKKLMSDKRGEVTSNEIVEGAFGLVNVALLALSIPTAISGLGLCGGYIGNTVGISSLPGPLAMIGTLTNLTTTIHGYTGPIAMPVIALGIALKLLYEYGSIFHSESEDSEEKQNIILANSWAYFGFMLATPAILFGGAAVTGAIGMEFLMVAGPLMAIGAIAWALSMRKLTVLQDMAKILGGTLMLGLAAAMIPETTASITILVLLELAAAGFAAYKLYQSVKDKQGIFHFGELNLDTLKEHGPTWALKLAFVAIPTVIGCGVGYGIVGGVISTLIAVILAGMTIYDSRNDWEEIDSERTKLYMIAGSAAAFPALATSSMSIISGNIALAAVSIAAVVLISAGTMAAVFHERAVERV